MGRSPGRCRQLRDGQRILPAPAPGGAATPPPRAARSDVARVPGQRAVHADDRRGLAAYPPRGAEAHSREEAEAVMRRAVRKTPRAEQDLLSHYVYLGERDRRAAERCLRAAEEAFALLARLPGMGRAWVSPSPRLAGVRSWTIPAFRNYRIFYRPIRNGIEVLHVLHARRDIQKLLEEEADED